MRARLVVFPIRGRIWCFSRSAGPSVSASEALSQPNTFKELRENISFSGKSFNANAELLVDFVANKMNKAWIGLEKAPEGSFKNKLHGLGLRLLSRVKPSEIFLRSITKEVTRVEVIYPSSLDARLVRRRLRHVAMRGTIIHKKYLYGSISMLPVTSAFAVLPLPNVPFFWNLFRAYSHWRALQGSERLFRLVSDSSITSVIDKKEIEQKDSRNENHNSPEPYWALKPSEELETLGRGDEADDDGLGQSAIKKICKIYDLDTNDVIKYRKLGVLLTLL
ncbi:hypothetical protein QN277_022209 [Acacia crassicarpa]|uniref:Uncharacterized protein n=2 Tax=Acacia crassicarpa TaxID=499986 RepID=A0AAE1JEM8_9FABA|nr:hypothetical protein QN277_022209 [Acacia crassicarpa]